MTRRKLKRFAEFTEQEGSGTAAPINTVGNEKIAGIGNDFPPFPAKKRVKILKRKLPKS